VTGRQHVLSPFLALALALGLPADSTSAPQVAWRPPAPRAGDVVVVEVREARASTMLIGTLGQAPLVFSAHGDRQVAIAGVDLDAAPGDRPWQIEIHEPGHAPQSVAGHLTITARSFSVQRLTLPRAMVELDAETERRALAEGDRLRALYRTISPGRLWRGRFVRPVSGDEPGSGFGSRRIINGLPRAPHSGVDYSAPTGAPVFAANSGRVALVGEFFFPGRLAIVDHGLGLYTLYFHLDTVAVREGQLVERGEILGTVGATGRVTGPHLHFGAQIGEARVDPEILLAQDLPD
jgi:murein DD-endopeptidase MepM/ murein hydrolase activator NlpD